MENDLQKKLDEQSQKLEAIYKSVEKTRKFFMWTLIITVALFILPLIGLAIAIPQFLATYSSALNF